MLGGRKLNTVDKADILSMGRFKVPYEELSSKKKHEIVKALASTMNDGVRKENGGSRKEDY